MYRRILVALKFSPVGVNTLQKALELAKIHQARLLIFHALDYRLMYPETPDAKIVEMTQTAEQRFESELRPLLGDYQKFAFNCWEADPSVEVCRLALETSADLVVIGCHRHPDNRSVTRIGQMGLSILETAPCPVLLIPCPE